MATIFSAVVRASQLPKPLFYSRTRGGRPINSAVFSVVPK
jgi:hypothetical protein